MVLNVYLSRGARNVNNAPTMEVVGLSQHPETREYLMAMQYADMGTLEKQPCEPDADWYTVLTYATKLASRLASLHEMGFLHQDLHPGNVVLHRLHIIHLIDVGISQAVQEACSEDGVYGRLEYLPPEVFQKDKQYTVKSDIYCLGTLLWQLVVGVSPQGIASSDKLREKLIPDAPIIFNNAIKSCWN